VRVPVEPRQYRASLTGNCPAVNLCWEHTLAMRHPVSLSENGSVEGHGRLKFAAATIWKACQGREPAGATCRTQTLWAWADVGHCSRCHGCVLLCGSLADRAASITIRRE
jgi:hypothetical protein